MKKRLLLACLSLALAACTLQKRDSYAVPDVAVPNNFKNDVQKSETTLPNVAEGAAVLPKAVRDIGVVEWWRSFASSELDSLIDRGLANNADLRIATLRLAQVRLRSEQAAAGRLPALTAPGLMAIQAPGGASAGGVPLSGGGGGNAPVRAYQGSLRAEWRLDVWGEQSALAESAALQVWRAAFERDNVQRGLVTSIASAYIEYISLNDRLRLARETEAVLAASLKSIQKRTEAGDATLTDLEQQRSAIFAVRASMPLLEQQREEALNALSFLVGTVPGQLQLSEAGLDSLALPKVLPGMPAALILRRPDVRMVEARMLAADADIDIARARILPSIDLSSQIGFSSLFLSTLLTPQTLFWNTLANLSASIFDGGKRRAEREISQSIHEELVETYIRSIYLAIREVETALSTIQLSGKRLDAQGEAMRSARRAWQISGEVYASGAVDYLTLLDTERTYHRQLDEYQRIRMDYVRAYINLFNALGGGVQQGDVLPGTTPRLMPVAEQARLQVERGEPAQLAPAVSAGIRLTEDSAGKPEEYWLVELPGLYHRSTVSAVWRDLRVRFPNWMRDRVVKPQLVGRIEESADAREAWFRLAVAQFNSPASAEAFCLALQTGQQRCRIVSSRGNVAVKSSPDAALAPLVPTAANRSPEMVDKSAEAKSSLPMITEEKLASPQSQPQTLAARSDEAAFAIQLAVYPTLDAAARSSRSWEQRGYTPYVVPFNNPAGGESFAVRVGEYTQRSVAEREAGRIGSREKIKASVVSALSADAVNGTDGGAR